MAAAGVCAAGPAIAYCEDVPACEGTPAGGGAVVVRAAVPSFQAI